VVLERADLELVGFCSLADGPSTVLSSSLRRVLPEEMEAVPVEERTPPGWGSLPHRSYARLHHELRSHVGAVVPIARPQTAFVAARPSPTRLRVAEEGVAGGLRRGAGRSSS
jgi:hypothetical protein